MNILISIDPSLTALGYAVWDAGKYESKCPGDALLNYGAVKTRPDMTFSRRFQLHRDMATTLKHRFKEDDVSLIAECQFYAGWMKGNLAKSVAACQMILGGWRFIFADYPFDTVEPSTWQGAMGIGRKNTKGMSIHICKLLTGLSVKDHNISDAILIGIWKLDHDGFAEKIRKETK